MWFIIISIIINDFSLIVKLGVGVAFAEKKLCWGVGCLKGALLWKDDGTAGGTAGLNTGLL